MLATAGPSYWMAPRTFSGRADKNVARTLAGLLGYVTDYISGCQNVTRHTLLGVVCLAAVATAAVAERGSREWPAYGGGAEQIRYSSLAQINRSNVRQLEVVWTFDAGETGGLQTNPIVVDGVLYTT